MMEKVAETGTEGINKEDYLKTLSDDVLVKPRIRDLVRDKLAYLEGGRYRLTPKGKNLAQIFIFFRSILKAPKGG